MKFFKYILSLFILTGVIYSCSDDDFTTLDGNVTAPTLNATNTNFALQSEDANMEAVTFSWNPLSLNVNTPVKYILEMAAGGSNFADAATLMNSNDTEFSMTVGQLNNRAVSMGIEPDTEGTLDVRVKARIGDTDSHEYVSSPVTLTVRTYSGSIDISTSWGVVGDATPNGWDGPDVPFWKTNEDGVLVAFAELTDGEIKFRENNSWDLNYGGSGGNMEQDGPNIPVSAGKYRIIINFNNMTYDIQNFSLGVVGDATPNGWDGPDVEMVFDPSSGKFRAVTGLSDGEIKFRLNNDWSENWGGSDGSLSPGGDNIGVSAGKYVITVDLGELTYQIEAIPHIWGLVGSGTPNGWDGPDVQLNIDYTSDYASGAGVWYVDNVFLTAEEVKFRADNDWSLNYGDDGADGTLEEGGENIQIPAAGNYDVVLDLDNLQYSITPH